MTAAEYQNKYWKDHPDKYEKHKARMRAYYQTKEGRETNTIALKIFRKRHPEYYSNYFRKLRKIRLAHGLCIRCGKRPIVKGYKECKVCKNQQEEYRKKRKV